MHFKNFEVFNYWKDFSKYNVINMIKASLKILFFIFIFGTNLSSEEINSWNELVRKGNIFYKKSDDQPFSGILKNYYPSGELSLIDNFKNGMQHGEFKSFYENGNILMSGIFKKGKQHGQWKEFHEDGSVYWKLNYYDGKEEDGLFRTFHKNGEVMSEVTYLNGKPNSNWIHFDELGKKIKVEYYENGKFFYEEHLDW